ncbi:hypothetical protein K353_04265 [Kitasatospora sp. SolWspMP-SS2h]|uniref:hypothetical protein n=1 Tax=Kitasatospora sp. SolWspMP-SS2h TaxID=1305729 RepID=UPI000DBA6789|nr:hypothetical protein [Kitasatospora sp. SolWspMP-SS2h]RAJ38331.1 hypothetical protein K353_04265 [Kitasatospora sp. SolWspMP-SS2h]
MFTALLALGLSTTAQAAVVSGQTTALVANADAGDPAPINLVKTGQYHTARARLANDVKVSANSTLTVDVAGVGGLPLSGLDSVALNISAKGDWFNSGSLALYPSGGMEPQTTALEYNPNFYLANLVTAKVGTDGRVKVVNRSDQAVKVYLDVQGYTLTLEDPAVTGGASYVPLAPVTVVDNQSVPLNGTFQLQALGQGGVPQQGVDAVALNIATLSPRDSGTLRVFPDGEGLPVDATIDYVPNRMLQNSVIAKVGANGKIDIHNLSLGATAVWVEVTGYFSHAGVEPEHLALEPLVPARIATAVSVPAGGDTLLAPRGLGGVPGTTDVSGVGIALDAKSTAGAGAVQVYPSLAANPSSRTVNYQAGNPVSGFTFAKLGSDGNVVLHNAGSAPVTVSVDVYSYTRQLPQTEPDMGDEGGSYLTNVTQPSADECAQASADFGTDLGATCALGTEVTVGPAQDTEPPAPPTAAAAAVPPRPAAAGTSAASATAAWKYRYVSATACYSTGKPKWGSGSGWKCKIAKATVNGEFKYNGSRVYALWVSSSKGDTYGADVAITWAGTWNNGAARGSYPGYMDIGLNGTVKLTKYMTRSFYIRIDCWPSGKVSLRGGGA